MTVTSESFSKICMHRLIINSNLPQNVLMKLWHILFTLQALFDPKREQGCWCWSPDEIHHGFHWIEALLLSPSCPDWDLLFFFQNAAGSGNAILEGFRKHLFKVKAILPTHYLLFLNTSCRVLQRTRLLTFPRWNTFAYVILPYAAALKKRKNKVIALALAAYQLYLYYNQWGSTWWP